MKVSFSWLWKFFGFVGKEAVAHPDLVKAGVDSALTKNPAPLVAAVEETIDKKTRQ